MPRGKQTNTDNHILEMAIVGYQSELEKLSAKIAEIKARLGQRGPGRPKATTAAAAEPTNPKRKGLSASARARIAAAQKARWAAYRKDKGGNSKAPSAKPKRKLSAAGRKAIIAATKKRWAAVRAAKTAAA
jgi:hypothetical protein